jgi:hypothetical protein
VRRVLRFLDVDDTAPIEALDANPTVQMRSQQLDEIVNAVSVGRGRVGGTLKRAIKTVVPAKARSRALHAAQHRLVHTAPDPPDPELMSELRRRYAPEVVALSEYLGRDLVAEWGYDGLA